MASSPSSAPPPTSSATQTGLSTPPPTTTPSFSPPSDGAPPPATPSSPPPTSPSVPPPPTAQPSLSTPPSTGPPSPPSTTTPSPPSPAQPSLSSPPSTGSPSPPSTTTRSPPPPSTGSSSPPSNMTSSNYGGGTPSSGDGDSSSTSTALVVGFVVAGAVVMVIFTLLCVCLKMKKRRNGRYHGEPPLPSPWKDNGYAGQPQVWQQNVHPPEDHAIKVPPHPSPPPAHASRPPQPPPPPPMFSSSGASGSNYSGSETPLPPPSPGMALGFSRSTFTFEELMRATDGFSDANLLGQGGFGYVHRGMLPNGKEVAVKQLKTGGGQGEREFQAEVEIISRVHHKHLVSLVGYCITGVKRLLIYEFVPNNTLEFHLHGKGRPTMEWSTRLKIALGSAKGLAYLHEDCHPKIIHRDIKATNILLDFKFEAKVSDFGLAKFSADNDTHISTRVMGTFGYLAPEYASSGKLTEKSDVFSFGVMLLELITGRRPVDTTNTYMDDSLVDWARPILTRALEDHNYGTLADPKLQNSYDPREMTQMVACAASCVRHSARRRPRMSQIVRALEGDVSLEDLNEGVKPGHSTMYGSLGSSEYDASQYNEDMKKFKKLALSSQYYASSEYGQNPSGSSSEAQTREMERAWMKKDSGGSM